MKFAVLLLRYGAWRCDGVEVPLHCHCTAFVVQCSGVNEHIYGLQPFAGLHQSIGRCWHRDTAARRGWTGGPVPSDTKSERIAEW